MRHKTGKRPDIKPPIRLAELADFHRTDIGSVERGERIISLDNICMLENALDMSASRLFELAESLQRQ